MICGKKLYLENWR